jgi:hypothetical protein
MRKYFKNSPLQYMLGLLFLPVTGICQDTIDAATFHKMLNNQFTSIISGSDKNTIGNFGAIDIKDAKLSLNVSHINKKYSILSLNANAAVSDGFSALFTNSKLNSNIGIQLRYSMMNPDGKSITYTRSSIDKRNSEIARAREVGELEKKLLRSRQAEIDSKIKFLGNELEAASEQRKITLSYLIDSLKLVRAQQLNDLAVLEKSIDEAVSASIKKSKFETPEITGFQFGWLNLVYAVNSESFRLFTPSKPYIEQVKKEQNVSHKGGIEYNYYKWSMHPGESYFFLVGATVKLTHNLSDLTEIELSETTNYGPAPGERVSVKKYNVYTGDYKRDQLGFNFYSDFYYFLFEGNAAALHFYPAVQIREKIKPTYSAGTGFMVSFKDNKDDKGKSILNAELYANFPDLTNTSDSDDQLVKRNEIGLRVAFPIKFFFK